MKSATYFDRLLDKSAFSRTVRQQSRAQRSKACISSLSTLGWAYVGPYPIDISSSVPSVGRNHRVAFILVCCESQAFGYIPEKKYAQIRLRKSTLEGSCCGAGEKLDLVAARTFLAHLFLHGCACVAVLHQRILSVPPCTIQRRNSFQKRSSGRRSDRGQSLYRQRHDL